MRAIRDLLAPLVERALDRRQHVEPFDFAAHDDPNTIPQPDRPIPDHLRLPVDDMP